MHAFLRVLILGPNPAVGLAEVNRKKHKMLSHKQNGTVQRVFYLAAICAGIFLFNSRASAAVIPAVPSITYNFDHTLTGVAPAGPTPWLTATFSDSGANSVQLTLSAPGLTGNEFVGQWYFNLNPLLNPASLAFAEIGSS